jgi:hypothetical protein
MTGVGAPFVAKITDLPLTTVKDLQLAETDL